jgi:tetratricopeptide (TPR) repeat protein
MVESALETMRALAVAVPEPTFVWQRLIYESVWANIQGDLAAAEQWALQACEAGTASGQPDALTIFGAQLFRIRYDQGRTGELAEQVVQFSGEPEAFAVWRAFAAIALIESDRADDARALALAEDFQGVSWDYLWSLLFAWADVCSRLGLADRAGELYDLLAPFHGRLAGGGLAFGSIDWALGRLATTLQRYEQAEAHFAAAAEVDERFGAPLLLARTRAGWARALTARGRPADLERAQRLLDQAEETAASLGGELAMREAAECRAALAATSAADSRR